MKVNDLVKTESGLICRIIEIEKTSEGVDCLVESLNGQIVDGNWEGSQGWVFAKNLKKESVVKMIEPGKRVVKILDTKEHE